MPNPNHPCIVILGIKETGLENIYALPPATTWSTWEAGVVVPDFDSLALDSGAEVDQGKELLADVPDLLDIQARALIALASRECESQWLGRW